MIKGLSTRAVNVLASEGIHTKEHLMEFLSKEGAHVELLKIPNLGKATSNEIAVYAGYRTLKEVGMKASQLARIEECKRYLVGLGYSVVSP